VRHIIHVCTTCNRSGTEAERKGTRAGSLLLDALSTRFASWAERDHFDLVGVACMSGCGRACTLALSAPGKTTYLFGDLDPAEAASQALDCAGLYWASSDGILARGERPPAFRAGILARIPAIPASPFPVTE
jgi:predicted metal-binding protein